MSLSARDIVLARILEAQSDTRGDPQAEYQAIDRSYQSVGCLSKDKSLELFVERLLEYGAGVHRCTRSEIGATVAERLHARRKSRIAIPTDIPRDWLPGTYLFIEEENLTYPELETCDGAITGCAAAVSDTGTIILDGTSAQGRRALTLLPDYHLCIVFEAQVFETFPEAIYCVSQSMSRPLTLISGPSATADIEMTRIQGVHGPRTMDVVLVAALTQ